MDDEQPRAGVVEDVGDLVRHQPRVDRDQHGARARARRSAPRAARSRSGRGTRRGRRARSRPPGARTASRRARSRSSAQVSRARRRRPRSARGRRARLRSRNESGVSGERWTAQSGGTLRRMAVRRHGLRAIRLREDGPAARITLNRPEKRNALSLELMQELIERARVARRESETRAIVIEGAGPAFSAGHDLGEMIGREPGFYQELFDVCTVLMETIHRAAAAGDREGARGRHRRRLPARRRLRPRRRRRGRALRDARASRSASSARRRWCPSHARSAASARSRCC